MPAIEVLKFGSSVLRSPDDLHVAVDEIYRRWRSGCRVLAVVSAFEGITDELMDEAAHVLGANSPEATAAYIATGEQRTAALLSGSLQKFGIPARMIDPREIGLIAEGDPLESTPTHVDIELLDRLWGTHPILVLPGFYGIDWQGRTALFGRGGSDLSALFLAATLRAHCRLAKDVMDDRRTAQRPEVDRARHTKTSGDIRVGGAKLTAPGQLSRSGTGSRESPRDRTRNRRNPLPSRPGCRLLANHGIHHGRPSRGRPTARGRSRIEPVTADVYTPPLAGPMKLRHTDYDHG
jgi:hypothetical protein